MTEKQDLTTADLIKRLVDIREEKRKIKAREKELNDRYDQHRREHPATGSGLGRVRRLHNRERRALLAAAPTGCRGLQRADRL